MKSELRKDIRFFVTLFMGFSLLVAGMIIPPLGYINPSVLEGAGMLFILAAIVLGADVPGIIREIRLLRKGIVEDITKDDKDEETEEDK